MPKDEKLLTDAEELDALFPVPLVVPVDKQNIAVRTLTISERPKITKDFMALIERVTVGEHSMAGVLHDPSRIANMIAISILPEGADDAAVNARVRWLLKIHPKHFYALADACVKQNEQHFGGGLGLTGLLMTAVGAEAAGDGQTQSNTSETKAASPSPAS